MVMALLRRAEIAGLLTMALVAGALIGAAADSKVMVYEGKLDNIELDGWGTGLAEVDEEEAYLDNSALRIDTTGFFEGGRLTLGEPVDAATFLANPANGYISMSVKIPEPEQPAPIEQPGAFPGADPGAFPAQPGVDPGMMPAPPPGEEVQPGAEGFPGGEIFIPGGSEMGPPKPPENITRLRVLLITDKGELDSGPIVAADYLETVQDWRSIVVPLSSFGGTADLRGAKITGIALFGDVKGEFFLGDLSLGEEDQPLVADAGEKMVVKANQEVTLKAKPQPGGFNATYDWDFDDLDGIKEEGYGPEPTWTFLTPGYYTVTLMVSDPQGKKVTRTARVHVKVE